MEVNWLWFILPGSLVVLSFLFLTATMAKSKRAGIRPWKTSALATLQGLSCGLHADLGPLDEQDSMEKAAENRFVMLRRQETGWRLRESK